MRALQFFGLTVILSMTGCISQQVTQQVSSDVNFASFKSASYSVHTLPTTEFGSDRKFTDEEIGLFDTLLGKKLGEMGYEKPPDGQPADFSVDIAVTESKEGSGAARFLIGMGAGRAVFAFDATFKSRDGRTIGAFQGGRSYTGMEVGHAFSDAEEIQVAAATRAVSQVELFVKDNGDVPKVEQPKNLVTLN